MSKPRLLDLFCGAGGAARGYQKAGFYVVGVDHKPQPNYVGDEFVQADALWVLRCLTMHGAWPTDARFDADVFYDFAAIHASPPCQANSALRVLWAEREYPKLIEPTRELLAQTDLSYVIENVVGAPLPRQDDLLGKHGVELCGSMFGLGVRRHRLFEANFSISQPPCAHASQGVVVGVYGHTGAGANRGRARANGQMNGIAEWRQAMGIDWMTVDEIAEAIPPAYTEHIGSYLLTHLQTEVVA